MVQGLGPKPLPRARFDPLVRGTKISEATRQWQKEKKKGPLPNAFQDVMHDDFIYNEVLYNTVLITLCRATHATESTIGRTICLCVSGVSPLPLDNKTVGA